MRFLGLEGHVGWLNSPRAGVQCDCPKGTGLRLDHGKECVTGVLKHTAKERGVALFS